MTCCVSLRDVTTWPRHFASSAEVVRRRLVIGITDDVYFSWISSPWVLPSPSHHHTASTLVLGQVKPQVNYTRECCSCVSLETFSETRESETPRILLCVKLPATVQRDFSGCVSWMRQCRSGPKKVNRMSRTDLIPDLSFDTHKGYSYYLTLVIIYFPKH